jgi:aspartyl-tRNA(Asn)/glutamyl-tRNA(Gln) amidotransferase subunit A
MTHLRQGYGGQASALALAKEIKDGKTTATAAVEQSLDRLKQLEPRLSAFNTVMAERALDRAKALGGGEAHGTAARRPDRAQKGQHVHARRHDRVLEILAGFAPVRATVVERLENAGAVIVGKTNLDRFAMGSSTENSARSIEKPVGRNPHTRWIERRSAATVARASCLALGSDTGGSIRRPARPVRDRRRSPPTAECRRYGLLAFASSLDQIGPSRQRLRTQRSRCRSSAVSILTIRPRHRSGCRLGAALTGNVTACASACRARFLGEGVDGEGVLKSFESALATLATRGATLVRH